MCLLLAAVTACTSVENAVLPSEIRTVDVPTLVETDDGIKPRSVLLVPIIEAIEKQKNDMLPFDEPRTEFGQQDGKLRRNWEHAYERGKLKYRFNGDTYYVFTSSFSPFVPQVCIDFIIDTIDIAAGSWYASSHKSPGRLVGNVDLRRRLMKQGYYPRRVTDVVEFFKSNPMDFNVVFEGEGATIGDTEETKKFFALYNVQVGDIVFISGKVPWDRKDAHNHSFFVTGLDENGLVEHITGNPVFPVERSLKVEGRRTPERKVTHIVRLTSAFLQEVGNDR